MREGAGVSGGSHKKKEGGAGGARGAEVSDGVQEEGGTRVRERAQR